MKFIYRLIFIALISSTNLFAETEVDSVEVAPVLVPVLVKDAANKLSSYLENMESYEANFQQQIVSSSRRLMDSSSGRFVMKRPDRFRWEIMTPYEQIIIADGQFIWSVDVDLEQVSVSNVGDSIVNSPISLLSRKMSRENNQLDKFFSVKLDESEPEIKLGSKMERFILSPIDTSSNFEQVQLGFDEGILQYIELHDSLGQITIVTMTNVRNNPIIDGSPFVYHEIPDFDVIDSRVQELESD